VWTFLGARDVSSIDVVIRPFVCDDVDALADVMWRSVREAALRDYTAAQVEAWLPERPTRETLERQTSDGRDTLVACDRTGCAVGYIDLERDGHIDHLYCAPEAVGTGVASQLYDAVEQLARSMDMPRLYVEASEAARRLFERKGFTVDRRRDWRLRGVAIHNYAMSKHLT